MHEEAAKRQHYKQPSLQVVPRRVLLVVPWRACRLCPGMPAAYALMCLPLCLELLAICAVTCLPVASNLQSDMLDQFLPGGGGGGGGRGGGCASGNEGLHAG